MDPHVRCFFNILLLPKVLGASLRTYAKIVIQDI